MLIEWYITLKDFIKDSRIYRKLFIVGTKWAEEHCEKREKINKKRRAEDHKIIMEWLNERKKTQH